MRHFLTVGTTGTIHNLNRESANSTRTSQMEMQHDSRSDVVWIGKYDQLPDTCCDCGSFTDNRVVVKHVDIVTESGKTSTGFTAFVLMLFVHVALGPIGWLFSALMDGGEDEEGNRTVKQKSRIKLPQCQLCHGVQPPEVIESRVSSFAFRVHPKFKQGLESLRGEQTT